MAEKTDYKGYLKQLEDFLAEYLIKKAPALPSNIKEIIVKVAPWLTLIFLILTLPLILAVLGLGVLFAPFSFMGGLTAGTSYIVAMAFALVMLVLEAIAIPGLFKRSKSAWRLLYYVALIEAVKNIVTLNFGGLIIFSLLGFYFLFQVREYYK